MQNRVSYFWSPIFLWEVRSIFNVGVIGFGYWGPNVARNFDNNSDCKLRYICDLDISARARAKDQFKQAEIVDNVDIIFSDKSIDIVAIVTPVSHHYELAKKALKCNKHIFIEKPMVLTRNQAKELIELSKDKNLVCIVDHTFLFTSAVIKIKEIIDSGEIGEILYFDSTRVNLGNFQHDVDVIWDLAPHDLSILFYISEEKPISVMASGTDHLNNGLVDIAYLSLKYDTKMIANFHLNWLSPVKIRRILIGGSKKMILFDDMNFEEKIKIYDKGIEVVNNKNDIHKLLINYRSGDVTSPNLVNSEALKLEIDYFISSIKLKNYDNLINSLSKGKQIVDILMSAEQSLNENMPVKIWNFLI